MEKITFLKDSIMLNEAFENCCNSSTELFALIAWVGNSNLDTPYQYLTKLKSVNIVFGVSFCQTHPNGIQKLIDLGVNLKVFESKETFHHKLYIFKHKKGYSIIMGSSNFTFSGFNTNYESNILIESDSTNVLSKNAIELFNSIYSSKNVLMPDENWLINYKKKFELNKNRIYNEKVNHPIIEDESVINSFGWLGFADWDTYLKLIKRGAKIHNKDYSVSIQDLFKSFNNYQLVFKNKLPNDFFDDIDHRRMFSGKGAYSWLGHVGASGKFVQLLTISKNQKKLITIVNRILEYPATTDYSLVENDLEELMKMGNSMKVWGRILAITRPELFCTVSNKRVQKSLMETLGISRTEIITPKGYIKVLKVIHQSPWYKSPIPKSEPERSIWKNRVAILDLVFMNNLGN